MTAGWRTVRRNDPADQYPEMIKPSSDDYVALARRTAARLAVVHGASADDLREVLEALGLIEPLSVSKPSARHRGQLGGSNPATALSGGKQAGSRARSTDDKGRWTPTERENPELCPKQLHPWTPENRITRPDRGDACKLCSNDTRRARRATLRSEKPAEPVRMCWLGKHPVQFGALECEPCREDRRQKQRQGHPLMERTAEKRRAASIEYALKVLSEMPTVEVSPVDSDGKPLPRCKSRLHYKTGRNVGSRSGNSRAGRCLACDRLSKARSKLKKWGVEAA